MCMSALYNKIKRLWWYLKIRMYNEHTVATFYRENFGVSIGEYCRIMDRRLGLFGGEPYLIEIGDNVTIAEDVKFITHDGGVGVLRHRHPGINVFGRIKIHDNCFIGVNSIIMPGVIVGDNSVIGAGSVVTKNVPENSVVAGVPARKICDIEEYENKTLNHCVYIEESSRQDKKKIVLDYLNKPSDL